MKRSAWGILILATVAMTYAKQSWLLAEVDQTINGPRTIDQRVQEYGGIVATRLAPDFTKAGVPYPPAKITLVILKKERLVELYAQASTPSSPYRYIRSYPIQAASGHLGPKLQEGDEQVPEGIYGVESLNPNSHYHLALHVNYPNALDRANAQTDGRIRLGGDIMIHGSNVSIGCVAMGDPAAEDLFVLAAQTGLPNVRLLFCPFDFRLTQKPLGETSLPSWTPTLYGQLQQALVALPLSPKTTQAVP